LGDASAGARHALVQQLLDAPRLYLSADAGPITDRGEAQNICAHASLMLVNPGARSASREIVVTLNQRRSAAQYGSVAINGRAVRVSTRRRGTVVPVDVPPGTTTIAISVDTPGVRCGATPSNTLPSISVRFGTSGS
jgi:hypothetical protein